MAFFKGLKKIKEFLSEEDEGRKQPTLARTLSEHSGVSGEDLASTQKASDTLQSMDEIKKRRLEYLEKKKDILKPTSEPEEILGDVEQGVGVEDNENRDKSIENTSGDKPTKDLYEKYLQKMKEYREGEIKEEIEGMSIDVPSKPSQEKSYEIPKTAEETPMNPDVSLDLNVDFDSDFDYEDMYEEGEPADLIETQKEEVGEEVKEEFAKKDKVEELLVLGEEVLDYEEKSEKKEFEELVEEKEEDVITPILSLKKVSEMEEKPMINGVGEIKKTVIDDIMNDPHDNIISVGSEEGIGKTNDRYIVVGNFVEDDAAIEAMPKVKKEIVMPPKYITQEEFENIIFKYRHNKYFDFSSCYKLNDLSMLRNLEAVEELNVADHKFLRNISFVENMPNLRVLNISGTRVGDLKPLANCKKLEILRIDSTDVCDLSPLRDLKELFDFSCWACLGIVDISPLKDLGNMRNLGLEMTSITSLESLQNLEKLEVLGITECKLTGLGPISRLKELRSLCVADNPLVEGGLRPLEGLEKMVYLNANECRLIDISPLESLKNLREVAINGNGVFDLNPLRNHKKLKSLMVNNNPITNLNPIRDVTSLKKIRAEGLQNPDLEFAWKLTKLVEFRNIGNRVVRNLEPLYYCTKMQNLRFSKCQQIEDLSPLVNMTDMEELYLAANIKIRDISPLRFMEKIMILDIVGTGVHASEFKNLKNCSKLIIFNISTRGTISDKIRRSKMVFGNRRKVMNYRKVFHEDDKKD